MFLQFAEAVHIVKSLQSTEAVVPAWVCSGKGLYTSRGLLQCGYRVEPPSVVGRVAPFTATGSRH